MSADSPIDLLAGLNPEQRQVAAHGEGPLLVLAGAGSGKTRAIVHRIARLILEDGVEPGAILAVTFTNKAAGEMAQRVAALLDGKAPVPSWIGTFHATCARILRIEAPRLSLPRSFTILDSDDQRRALLHVARDLLLATDRPAMARYQAFIENARNQGWLPNQAYEAGTGPLHEICAKVYNAYHRKCRLSGTLDFGDLMLAVLELLDTDERARGRWQHRFQHVLVDEFQDTNPVQYRLLQRLVGPPFNLTAVGDDDQAIYAWRGATVGNLLGFEHDFPGTEVVRLEQNYRSTQAVLDVANALIVHNTDRHEKVLWTELKGGPKPVHFAARDDREESQWVARKIESLLRADLDPGDVAVFYRVNAQSRSHEEQLRAHGIPYRVVGGTSFYDREEIKDLLAYLRAGVNPRDDVAVGRIANVPRRGLGAKSLERARRLAAAEGLSLLQGLERLAADPDASLTSKARHGIEDLVAILAELSASADRLPPAELARWLVDAVGYEVHLAATHPEDSDDRRDNVDELIRAMRWYEDEQRRDPTGEPATLAAFLERSALVQPTDTPSGADAVNLMTIHMAKGLEFDAVFTTGLEEGLLPYFRRDEEGPENLAEERRLAYVATTRARRLLFLTHALTRRLYGGSKEQRPSRFLGDIPEALLEVDSLSAGPRRRRTEMPEMARRARQAPAWDESDQRPRYRGMVLDDIEIPADGLRFTRPTRDDSELDGYLGRTARHKSFGDGRITHAEYTGGRIKLTVVFPGHGEKKVISQFVEII